MSNGPAAESAAAARLATVNAGVSGPPTQTALPVPGRLTIGVTGHRGLLPDQEPALRVRVRAFFERLRGEFPDLPLQVVSALAEGAEQLAAEEALALNIPVLVPLPMAQDDYEQDFSDPAAVHRFRTLLERCQPQVLPPDTGAAAESMARSGLERDRQYARLGIFISSHSQILMALWDGAAAEAVGDTAEVVHFHLHEQMPMLEWSAPMPNPLADDCNDLVYHLPCPRRKTGHGDAAAADIDPEPRWLTAGQSRPGDGPMPNEYHIVFAHMQIYNRDLQRHAEAISSQSWSILPADWEQLRDTSLMHRLNALHRQSDWLAIHYQRQVRRGLLATHVLAVAMGLAFIAYDNVIADWRLLLTFLLCFGIGFVWYRIGHRRDWHRKYLDYRALAEGLRVQLYWHLAGVHASDDILFAYDSFLQKQDVELGWIRHIMRNASLLHDRRRQPASEWLRWVLDDWIGAADAGTGQLGYYRRKGEQCERHHRLTQGLGMLALITGVGIAGLLLVLHGRLPELIANLLLVLAGMLPLIAGVREAYSYKKADKELIKQYRFMTAIFTRARHDLDAAVDDADRLAVLKALGEACLQEHTEWILMHRERPLEHSQMS